MVGDIVITPVPYTDLSGVKIRPAVVLADVGMGDWILCEITSSNQSRPQNVQLTQQDLRAGSLRQDSVARPDRIYALNQRLFRRIVGQLTDVKRDEILDSVRSLF